MHLVEEYELNRRVSIDGNEDITALFRMTPYGSHTPENGLRRLNETEKLDITLSFHFFIYRK